MKKLASAINFEGDQLPFHPTSLIMLIFTDSVGR